MSGGSLPPLQERALEALAGLRPRWTLVGGAALAGFHLGHRETRDLDLFWMERDALGDLVDRATAALRAAGLVVERRESGSAFARLGVSDGAQATVVDLVADPAAPIAPPEERDARSARILVASAHALLVDKLCALLSRSEPRDLVDVRALLEAGGDLAQGLADAPRRDAGFSPLTLAWTLRSLPIGALARWGPDLPAWRDGLVARLLALGGPEP